MTLKFQKLLKIIQNQKKSIQLTSSDSDFSINKNNKEAHCSIRSLHTFNSLIISEKFKGGGHKTSGGFGIKLSDLFHILNNNFLVID